MRRIAAIGTAALLAGCGATTAPRVQSIAPPPVYGQVGLERVMGRDAVALVALFGKPDADVSEGSARKLQFASSICVLDAYLYPKGSSVPLVTHVDSRQPDGSPIDRASCVAALTRRGGGK